MARPARSLPTTPPRAGPLASRCHAAAARAHLHPGTAAGLVPGSLEEVRMLRGLRLREMALLGDYLHTVPRLTGRWVLDFAEQERVLGVLQGAEDLAPEDFLARAARDLGWAPDRPAARAAALALLQHLAELQLLAEHKGRFTWRGPGVVRDLALPPGAEVRARELFGGTLAFYRACLDALPEVLRGQRDGIAFREETAALWEGVLGSPEQLLLRRLGLRALPEPPRAVLDLACGPGFSTACIVEEWPGSEVTAIDFTDAYYRRVEARVRESAAGVGFPATLNLAKPWPGWGEPLPFPDASFDAAFFPMNDGFVPAHRRRDVYAEIRRILRPGGHLLVVTAVLPDDTLRPRPWELRAQALFHHLAEFGVAGFHGLSTAAQQVEALRGAGFPLEERPWRFDGLVWDLRAP